MFICISTAQARTKYGNPGLRNFISEFAKKMILAKFWYVFRLSRLAQSVGRGSGLRYFACEFLSKMTLVGNFVGSHNGLYIYILIN